MKLILKPKQLIREGKGNKVSGCFDLNFNIFAINSLEYTIIFSIMHLIMMDHSIVEFWSFLEGIR